MIGPRPEAIAEAEGKIKTADALVAFSQAHLDYHTIRSPIDGVLDSLTCHPGQTIAIGSPIGEVVDTRQVFAVGLARRPRRRRRCGVGQAAGSGRRMPRRRADAGRAEDEEMAGKVAFVGRVADPQTGNLPVRVLVDNPPGRLDHRAVGPGVDHRGGTQGRAPGPGRRDPRPGRGAGPVRRPRRQVGRAPPRGRRAARGLGGRLGTDLKAGEPVIVEGGYNLPERHAGQVPSRAEKAEPRTRPRRRPRPRKPSRTEPKHEPTLEPDAEPTAAAGGINLVALARPYFGLIVLTTGLLTAFGVVSMLRMPSGIYPEVAFPRIVVIAQTPGLAVKDVEVAVTRPIEEAVGIVLGVVRVRSKSVRGRRSSIDRLRPGTDMIQALNDVRARMAEVGAQLPPGTTTITERQTPSVFPIISFVVTGGRDPSALHDYAYYDLRPRISRIPDVSYVTVQGGDIREILVEVDPQAPGRGQSLDRRRGRPPGQGAPAQGGRPARPRGAAISGAGRHPGDRPARPGGPGHRREERPVDPAARPRPGRRSGTRTGRWRSGPTARTPWR